MQGISIAEQVAAIDWSVPEELKRIGAGRPRSLRGPRAMLEACAEVCCVLGCGIMIEDVTRHMKAKKRTIFNHKNWLLAAGLISYQGFDKRRCEPGRVTVPRGAFNFTQDGRRQTTPVYRIDRTRLDHLTGHLFAPGRFVGSDKVPLGSLLKRGQQRGLFDHKYQPCPKGLARLRHHAFVLYRVTELRSFYKKEYANKFVADYLASEHLTMQDLDLTLEVPQ